MITGQCWGCKGDCSFGAALITWHTLCGISNRVQWPVKGSILGKPLMLVCGLCHHFSSSEFHATTGDDRIGFWLRRSVWEILSAWADSWPALVTCWLVHLFHGQTNGHTDNGAYCHIQWRIHQGDRGDVSPQISSRGGQSCKSLPTFWHTIMQ